MDKVAECPVCEINVYDRGKLNRKFKVRTKTFYGYPTDSAMPCLMTRADCSTKDNPIGRCPFETEQEQSKLGQAIKDLPKISGNNTYE